MAVAAVGFLFFKGGDDPTVGFNQHIMGGNLASTLAGEFSYVLAVAFALAFLGVLARAFDERRFIALAAALLAATVLSHLVVAIFAVLGALIVWAMHRPFRNLNVAAAVGGVGALVTAVWVVPLLATLAYTTDTRYEPITEFVTYMFPSYLWWAFLLALVAIVAGVLELRRSTLVLVLLTLAGGLLFRLWEEWGQTPAWNLRFLPFWYLGVFLLAGVGAAELVRGAAALAARFVAGERPGASAGRAGGDDAEEPATGAAARATTAPSRGLVRLVTIGSLMVVLPLASLWRVEATEGFLPYWVRWNYSGYEETDGLSAKDYPEFRRLMDTMAELPPGRALWEPGGDINRYGTTIAPMLLPYYTDGRITSMEGVYYEASATTPYFFMAAAALAESPSNNVRELPYRTIADFDLGVEWMRVLGVRYYLAHTAGAIARADANTDLRLVATVPDLDGNLPDGWRIYEVLDSEMVASLEHEPAVVEDVAPHDWQDEVGVPWFDDPEALDRLLTADGPSEWRRAPADEALDVARREVESAGVSDVEVGDDSISFRVERTGAPVVVKTSYFPNWRAEGASGPYRATPNYMVVVPTEEEVRLEYATTDAEWLGRLGTVLGLIGLGALVWWGRRLRPFEDGRGATVVDGEPAGGR
jgi:6-pyruvoyl-tetrahydropterin synthase related domain